MEFVYQKFKTYVCTIEDFEGIERIHLSQPKIHGVKKTIEYYQWFDKNIKLLLDGQIPGSLIIGVKNLETNEIVTYQRSYIPENGPFGYSMFGEGLKGNQVFGEYSGSYGLIRLMGMITEEKKIFDFFLAVQQQAYLPMMRVIKDYSVFEGSNQRYEYFLHKVVEPDQKLITPIEKILLQNLLVPITHPVAIVQCSLKAEYRIPHYSKYYGLSPEGIKRNLPN